MKKLLQEKNLKVVEIQENKIVPYAIYWYRSEGGKDNFMAHIKLMWGLDSNNITKKSVKDFLEKQIDTNNGYLSIDVQSVDHAVVIFNADKWLRDNFLDSKKNIEYLPPATLIFKFKKKLPKKLMANIDWVVFKNWLTNRFRVFLKEHKKRIFEDKKLIKLFKIDWLDVEVDLQMNCIYLKVKTQIYMAILLGLYEFGGKNKKIESFKMYSN